MSSPRTKYFKRTRRRVVDTFSEPRDIRIGSIFSRFRAVRCNIEVAFDFRDGHFSPAVLIKEMQSLCLDVKVLDINQEEIDLKQNFDDDPMPSRESYSEEDTEDTTEYTDDELNDVGYSIDNEENVNDSEYDDGFNFDEDENNDDEEDLSFTDEDPYDSFEID